MMNAYNNDLDNPARDKVFLTVFKMPEKYFKDSHMSSLTNKYVMDPNTLERWLRRVHGYRLKNDGSVYDFILKIFGDDMLKLIMIL